MKTTVNFLEAVKALSEGECEKIINEAGAPYCLNKEGLVAYRGSMHGISLRPESFLGEWKLIGVKHKVVIENVGWEQDSDGFVRPYVTDGAGFGWKPELLNKPKMKMTLEWISSLGLSGLTAYK